VRVNISYYLAQISDLKIGKYSSLVKSSNSYAAAIKPNGITFLKDGVVSDFVQTN
jgi:hypothetical protein